MIFGCLALCARHSVGAQDPQLVASKETSVVVPLVGNMLIGGLTSVTHALLARKSIGRAFSFGAVGGAVHFGGKLIGSSGRSFSNGLPGLLVGGLGISVVANAGYGKGPFEEVYLPVGPIHVRVKPDASPRIRLTISGYDALVLGRNLLRDGIDIDWARSAGSGTFVFVTENKLITTTSGDTLNGVASASSVVLSAFTKDLSRTLKHEMIHVQQYHFVEETWGQPIENSLRKRIVFAKRLPSWLEVGVATPIILKLDGRLARHEKGLLRRLQEAEAEWFERR